MECWRVGVLGAGGGGKKNCHKKAQRAQPGKAATKDRIIAGQNHAERYSRSAAPSMILSHHDSVGFCPRTQNLRSLRIIPTIAAQTGRDGAGCEWFRALSAGTPPHGQAGSLPPQRLEMKHNHFHLRKNSQVTAAARAKEQRTGSGTGPGPPESPVQELWVAAAKLVGIRL